MKKEIYDAIIIGAGPAGLTAGFYTARFGLKTLILESRLLGGRAQEAANVENFPGFPNGIAGADLTQKMIEQAKKFGAEIRIAGVVGVNTKKETKIINTKKRDYETQAIIVATGTQRRKLLVPGETKFLGQGVSYCPVCDGAFFKNLNVTVVGSGDEAAMDTLFLTEIARKVIMISSEEKTEMSEMWRKRLEERNNFQILLNTKVKEIEGENFVEAIKVVNLKTNEELKIATDGVFVSLGRIPMTEVMQKAGIEVDQNGCITVDRQQRTNMEGVFAAGDCTCGGMQIITAAGEGATAAIRASSYVRNSGRSHT